MIETLGPEGILVLGLAALALMTLLALVGGLAYAVGEPRRRLKRRIAGLGLQPGAGDAGVDRRRRGGSIASAASGGGSGDQSRQRRIQEKLRELERDKADRARRRNRARLRLLQAGVRMDHRVYMAIMVGLGVLAAMAVVLAGLPVLVAVPTGVTVGFGLPRLVLAIMTGRRQRKFTNDFPDAIDVLVRGVQSGLPVSECVSIVGREVPDPVGSEFRMMVEGQRVGLSLTEIMARGLERMPTPEYKFFAIVLQIQQQTGGNLAETLANLSSVIRDRKQMRSKVKALSSEAKASAWIIGSLPFIVAALVSAISPGYMVPLFTKPLGHIIIACGLCWMLIGVGIMAKMINFKM